jgi:chemotaxis methyl-accepting protein methylase
MNASGAIADSSRSYGSAALLPKLEIARELIASRYGFWVHDSWSGQLAVCLEMRASATGRRSVTEYVNGLRRPEDGGAELATLLETILNGETHFLRTQPHFDALINAVLPTWRMTRVRGQRFRIASLGCSTGEEPYSIALVLRENLSADVEVTGADVNARSLAHARAGAYESSQLRELSPQRRAQWFAREQNRWLIHPVLRSSVRFLQHNLLEPLPFAGLDVIFCRNVLIYFQPPMVASCIREFHAALRPGGFLFLGHSESAFGFPEYFEPVQIPDGVIYQSKPSAFLSQ